MALAQLRADHSCGWCFLRSQIKLGLQARCSKYWCAAHRHTQDYASTAGADGSSRRTVLLSTAAALLGQISTGARQARADVIQNLAKQILRPEMEVDQAIVDIMDARGVLLEIKALSQTPQDSRERFVARRLLPGMAKRLRQVGVAAPVVAALMTGDKEGSLSEEYGGTGTQQSVAVPVYEAIGRVVTISGRTIRKEALADPDRALAAIGRIESLLAQVPKAKLIAAQEFREARARDLAV